MHLNDLREKEIIELTQMAEKEGIENPGALKKHEVIFALLKKHAENDNEIL